MGSGFSGIYSGTHGSMQSKGPVLRATAPSVRDLTVEQIALIAAAIGTGIAVDEAGLPKVADALRQAYGEVRSAVAAGDVPVLSPEAGEVQLPSTLDDGDVWRLANAVLAVRLLTWAASAAADLGIEDVWESDDDGDDKPGIYENCKVAEAALNRMFPDEVAGSRPDEATTRFAFHEEAGGGHFGVDDSGKGKKHKTGSRSPVYVIEQCDKIGGIFAPAIALFLLLGRGGSINVLTDERDGGTGLPTGTGMIVMLDDGTYVVYRWDTSTAKSSGLEVSKSGDTRVVNHKVHFFEGMSRQREKNQRGGG